MMRKLLVLMIVVRGVLPLSAEGFFLTDWCRSWFCDSPREFFLIRGGNPSVEIVRPQEIAKTVDSFNAAVHKCTGTTFRVSAVRKPTSSSPQLVFEVQKMALERDDSFSIDFPEDGIMRIVCSRRSARWAVNYLLEIAFGVRFLFPVISETKDKLYGGEEVNDYPRRSTVSVPRKKVIQQPYSFPLLRTVDWRSRPWDQNWGVKAAFTDIHWIAIAAYPIWKYGPDQSWPQEILPEHRGKKITLRKSRQTLPDNPFLAKQGYDTHWNPCFSHPRSADIAIRNILEDLRKHPDKHEIGLSINDNGGHCDCSRCRALVKGRRNADRYPDYSVPYYAWVNRIAEGVTKEYPEVYFTVLAYREVLDPPPFKVHPKVVVQICFEVSAMNDSKIKQKRLATMQAWQGKARHLMLWDYTYGFGRYLFPRLYFKSQAEYMKLLHEDYGVRGMFVEATSYLPFEGPKHRLIFELMKNIKADPEQVVMDWCRDAVGKESAPFLRNYYQFWEDYWAGEDIRKTNWYASVNNIYLQLGEAPTHTFALKKGDMARLRSLMEQVVENAKTPAQKRRAGILMQAFEYCECAAQAMFSELLPPDGALKDAEEAALLLKQVPEAFAALRRMKDNPFTPFDGGKYQTLSGVVIANVGKILPFIGHADVQRELKSLLKDQGLPGLLRGQISIWLGAKAVNLVENGSFEQPTPLPTGWNGGKLYASRDSRHASHGSHALCMKNSLVAFKIPVQPGKTYMVMLDAFTPCNSSEGRFNFMLTTRTGNQNRNHIKYEGLTLGGNIWQPFCGVTTIPKRKDYAVDTMLVEIYPRKFEADERVWVDNVRIFCLDELKSPGL